MQYKNRISIFIVLKILQFYGKVAKTNTENVLEHLEGTKIYRYRNAKHKWWEG